MKVIKGILIFTMFFTIGLYFASGVYGAVSKKTEIQLLTERVTRLESRIKMLESRARYVRPVRNRIQYNKNAYLNTYRNIKSFPKQDSRDRYERIHGGREVKLGKE